MAAPAQVLDLSANGFAEADAFTLADALVRNFDRQGKLRELQLNSNNLVLPLCAAVSPAARCALPGPSVGRQRRSAYSKARRGRMAGVPWLGRRARQAGAHC